jgi:hypothetical protein
MSSNYEGRVKKVNAVFVNLGVAYINNMKFYLYVLLLESIYIVVGLVVMGYSELTQQWKL